MPEIYYALQHKIGSLWLDSGKESSNFQELEEFIVKVKSGKEYRIQERIKNQYNPKRKSCC